MRHETATQLVLRILRASKNIQRKKTDWFPGTLTVADIINGAYSTRFKSYTIAGACRRLEAVGAIVRVDSWGPRGGKGYFIAD